MLFGYFFFFSLSMCSKLPIDDGDDSSSCYGDAADDIDDHDCKNGNIIYKL